MFTPFRRRRTLTPFSHPQVLPLLLVLLLFPLSTLLIIGTMWTLPIRLPHLDNDDPNHTHSVFPKTVADLRALAWALKGYSETGPWELAHVLTVLGVVALWKHAWSIPGSALLVGRNRFSTFFGNLNSRRIFSLGRFYPRYWRHSSKHL